MRVSCSFPTQHVPLQLIDGNDKDNGVVLSRHDIRHGRAGRKKRGVGHKRAAPEGDKVDGASGRRGADEEGASEENKETCGNGTGGNKDVSLGQWLLRKLQLLHPVVHCSRSECEARSEADARKGKMQTNSGLQGMDRDWAHGNTERGEAHGWAAGRAQTWEEWRRMTGRGGKGG